MSLRVIKLSQNTVQNPSAFIMGKDVFNVAVVGLGFGAEFLPIHQAHPNLNLVAVCRRNEEELNEVADRFGIAKRYVDYDELLKEGSMEKRYF